MGVPRRPPPMEDVSSSPQVEKRRDTLREGELALSLYSRPGSSWGELIKIMGFVPPLAGARMSDG